MDLKPLILNKGADKRLRGGHVWVYSNEIDTERSPLKSFEPGEQVQVLDAQGRPRGNALINPNTLICGRLFTRNPEQRLNRSLFVHRLNVALSLRTTAFDTPCYRLVYGDSDGLPGLVIDRFFDVFVVQISTAGMELLQSEIIDALNKVFKPEAILMRNDGKFRQTEGLDTYVEEVQGSIPELSKLQENGVDFVAPLKTGQKTGWFYDHRENRQRMKHWVRGKRVLDLFSYIGGWRVQALAAGAEEVVCVDASAGALDVAQENARINGKADRLKTVQGDAFDVCKALVADRERFDLVVVDPPAFIMRKKDQRNGERAYARINNFAMRLLKHGGTLVSASCSMHLQTETLVDLIRTNSRELDRQAQIFARGAQGSDHPVHASIPETDYLKALFVRLLQND